MLLDKVLTLIPLYEKVNKIEDFQSYFLYHLLFKQRYNIDIPADVCGLGNFFELITIKLKDIKRVWVDGKRYNLKNCSPYRYLVTRDQNIYFDYIKKHLEIKYMRDPASLTFSLARFNTLEKNIKKQGYDPAKSVIVINANNEICDGLHRSSILLYMYGEEYEIKAVRISRISNY